MKIVVFGPFKRTGALHGESVVDLSRAYAKYLQERAVEPNPLEMADVVVPSDLVRLIEGGPRALEAALGEDDGIDIARELDGLSGFRSAPTGTPRQTNSAGNI